jgi:hypothetical protein
LIFRDDQFLKATGDGLEPIPRRARRNRRPRRSRPRLTRNFLNLPFIFITTPATKIGWTLEQNPDDVNHEFSSRISSGPFPVAIAEKEGTTPKTAIGRWEVSIPMKRLGTPEAFTAFVAFLASDRSGDTTGAAIQIDGGWYKRVM